MAAVPARALALADAPPAVPADLAPQPGGRIDATPRPARIIAARRYTVKPMTAEEAALRLSGETDQFLVFRDADTARLGVLYKRTDGNFGLIEP